MLAEDGLAASRQELALTLGEAVPFLMFEAVVLCLVAITILFLKNRPTSASADAQISFVSEVVAMIQMSHQTLKDVSIVLDAAVQNLEKEWGEIETPFTRQRAVKQ